MGLPPQFVYDENVKLRAEIERLRAENAATIERCAQAAEQAVPFSENVRLAVAAIRALTPQTHQQRIKSEVALVERAIAYTIERCAQWIEDNYSSARTIALEMRRALKEKP